MRTRTGVASVVAGLALSAAVAGTAAAAPYQLGPDLKVSGPSTLTGCTAGASPDFATAYDNTEVEPQVAVNPTDPDEITGASQQDRWPDGGARGLTSWMSNTGGASWAKLPDVPWSACQGGPARFGRVTDPWVSYDGGGNLYFIGQPIDSAALGISAISVTTLERDDLAAAADPDRGPRRPRRDQRQGVDHRRPDAAGLCLRDVDPVHASLRADERPRTPISTRSRSVASR